MYYGYTLEGFIPIYLFVLGILNYITSHLGQYSILVTMFIYVLGLC